MTPDDTAGNTAPADDDEHRARPAPGDRTPALYEQRLVCLSLARE